jgi:mannose-6-phosphate isomerase-like protein (cupin superfamily)
MADVTVKKIEDFEVAFGGGMKLVRHGLGVEAFGIQVIDMPANADQYPEHDHTADGQEEVYTVVDGAATIRVGGEEYELKPGTFVRVGPSEKRKIITGDQPARLIAIGATPGKAYEISPFTVPAAA